MDKTKHPVHHLLVETSSWSEVLKARHDGASWDQLKTRTGLPALGMAIFENSSVAVQLLLEVGAPAQAQVLDDKSVWSPLWAAMGKKNYRIVDLLLQAGADPDEEHPVTCLKPLQVASKAGDHDATLVLCRHGARPNTDSLPSPLWLWVKHTVPQKNPDGPLWSFPDPAPILSLLAAGSRVNEVKHQSSHMGMGAIELARRLWFEHPMSNSDTQAARLVLSAMERSALMEQAAENDDGKRRRVDKSAGQVKI